MTSPPPGNRPPRVIRSFVRREGRITVGQQRALQDLWPRYGLEADAPLDLARVFGRDAPRTLEIGFGNGALTTNGCGYRALHQIHQVAKFFPGFGPDHTGAGDDHRTAAVC